MSKKVRLLVLISTALVSIAMTSCTSDKGDFLLTNKSNKTITRAVVSVCNQTIELNSIQPNKSASGFFEVKSDSHYDVMVEYGSGRTLHKNVGYVTNGFNFHGELVVTDTDIKVSEDRRKT